MQAKAGEEAGWKVALHMDHETVPESHLLFALLGHPLCKLLRGCGKIAHCFPPSCSRVKLRLNTKPKAPSALSCHAVESMRALLKFESQASLPPLGFTPSTTNRAP